MRRFDVEFGVKASREILEQFHRAGPVAGLMEQGKRLSQTPLVVWGKVDGASRPAGGRRQVRARDVPLGERPSTRPCRLAEKDALLFEPSLEPGSVGEKPGHEIAAV